VLFEGSFPRPAIDPALRVVETPDLQPAQAGRLLFVGCSEVFRNGDVSAPGGDNAHFLLNCAAALALPPDLAAILARRSAPPAIGFLGPLTRILSRVYAIGAGPVLILVLGGWIGRRRRARWTTD
jgi:hypothetical protein